MGIGNRRPEIPGGIRVVVLTKQQTEQQNLAHLASAALGRVLR